MTRDRLREIIKEEILKLVEVRVETNKYKFAHGKLPRGTGTWFFKIGDEEKSWSGKYTDASKQAQKYAKSKGVMSIEVMS